MIEALKLFLLVYFQMSRPIDMNRQGDLMAEFEELL